MSQDDKEYLGRRERDHRMQAAVAATDQAKQAHLDLAEHYAAKARTIASPLT